MKFEIDIENTSLSEYFSEDEEGNLTVSDVFKDEIVSQVALRISWDDELRSYVRKSLDRNLSTFVSSYKDEAAIKVVLEDLMAKELKNGFGSIVRPAYKDIITNEVREKLAKEMHDIHGAIRAAIANEVKQIINTMYAGNKLAQFIDTEKLANYVISTMSKEEVNTSND